MHTHPKTHLHQIVIGMDLGSCGSERLFHRGQWESDVGVGTVKLSWGMYKRNNGHICSHGTIWWNCVHGTTNEDIRGGGIEG